MCLEDFAKHLIISYSLYIEKASPVPTSPKRILNFVGLAMEYDTMLFRISISYTISL